MVFGNYSFVLETYCVAVSLITFSWLQPALLYECGKCRTEHAKSVLVDGASRKRQTIIRSHICGVRVLSGVFTTQGGGRHPTLSAVQGAAVRSANHTQGSELKPKRRPLCAERSAGLAAHVKDPCLVTTYKPPAAKGVGTSQNSDPATSCLRSSLSLKFCIY